MDKMYLQLRPGLQLAPFVEMLWYCEGYGATHRRERVLPNGRLQLLIDLAPRSASSILIGMRTSHTILETAAVPSVIGILFRPGGTLPFFRPPAGEFHNRVVALDQLWGSATATLRDRLLESPRPAVRLRILEAHLTSRLAHSAQLHSSVRYALAEIGRDTYPATVRDVARDTGFSRRWLTNLFRDQIGLPPKLYFRLGRFQQVVRRIASGASVDWAQVSLDGGYYDQSHMAHEFREFSGISPGAWQSSQRPFLNHAVVE